MRHRHATAYALPLLLSAALGAPGCRTNTGGGDSAAAPAAGATAPAADSSSVAGTPTPTPPSGATAGGQATSPNSSAPPPAANVKAVPWPAIDFVSDPGGGAPLTVALSFDDGPDGAGTLGIPGARLPNSTRTGSNTSGVLDALKSLGLKATFFICSKRATDLAQDPLAQADLNRIIAEGHDLANHTVDHAGFDGTLTVAQGVAEFTGVQATLNSLLGASAPQLTMYRTPYGKPYQDDPNLTPMYAASTAPFGVHVGWGIDSHDWQCAQSDGTTSYTYNGKSYAFQNDPNCVLNNVKMFVDAKQSGVVLMHAIYEVSVVALPLVVQLFRDNGYKFAMVEDFIRAKYGGSSADLAAANKAAAFDANTLNAAAVASVKRSAWVLGTNAN